MVLWHEKTRIKNRIRPNDRFGFKVKNFYQLLFFMENCGLPFVSAEGKGRLLRGKVCLVPRGRGVCYGEKLKRRRWMIKQRRWMIKLRRWMIKQRRCLVLSFSHFTLTTSKVLSLDNNYKNFVFCFVLFSLICTFAQSNQCSYVCKIYQTRDS